MPPTNIRILAPAKINLFLHITGKLPDGYHTLQSLMGFVETGDVLDIAPHDSLYIDVAGPFAGELGNPRDNLVYKAAVMLFEHYRMPPRGRIVLTKNLPIAAGLGGGSSDAAATMRGLVRLWNMHEDWNGMEKIARHLGADVIACLYKKLVWAEGIGDRLTALPDPIDLHLVLVNPMIHTPTAEVFRHLHMRYSQPIQFSGRRKSTRQWIADLQIYRNDLTDAAIAVTPEIKDVLVAIAHTKDCRLNRLSGSGATCFGVYDSAEAAQAAAEMLQRNYPGWWVEKTALLRY
jgi:4-diphosphocytidyl-2-C-methyl-D-erythritol kinase